MTSHNRYRDHLYPLLARLDAERAHHLALRALHTAAAVPGGDRLLGELVPAPDPRLAVQLFGLSFPNPLGAAAGFDKDAEAIAGLFALGFGAVEVGTVTLLPQPGNPSPRLWRFPEQDALVNALGFPSEGAAVVRERLLHLPKERRGIVGINLGKNRQTPPELAAQDYVAVLAVLWDLADYVTVNVSSPNTPGLRDLQRREALTALLGAVIAEDARLARLHGGQSRPVLVKLAPDLDDAQLAEAIESALESGVAGVIVANTTTSRAGLPAHATELPGGTSGRPLRERATELVRRVRRQAPQLPIVGVGGIATAADVIERMRAGASLVQLYTGFIYGGPSLPGSILRDLSAYLDREGQPSLAALVGSEEPVSR